MTDLAYNPTRRHATPRRLPGLPPELTMDGSNASARRRIELWYGPRGHDEIPAGTRLQVEVDGPVARLRWRGWPAVVDADALALDVRDGG